MLKCSLMPSCTPPCRGGRRKPELDRKALVQSRLVARKQVVVARTVLERRTLACCRFASGSSYRIGCGGLTMEPGIWGRPERGRLELELVGTIGHMLAAGSLGPVVAGIVALARSHRCRSDHKGLS